MENYRCLAIGINGYQFLQPLRCAVSDAQTLREFLGAEVSIPPSQILLLTDSAPQVTGKSTYPSRDNILSWLQDTNQPTHSFWFFFRGYGVNHGGEDYLMAIDSNPQDIPNTGISLRSLFKSLQQQGANSTIAILDLNLLLMPETVGKNIISLGKEIGISVILSTQTTLAKGMLTTALLEALSYYRHSLSLAQVDTYLRERLRLIENSSISTYKPLIISPSLAVSYKPIFSPQKNQDRPRETTARNSAKKVLLTSPSTPFLQTKGSQTLTGERNQTSPFPARKGSLGGLGKFSAILGLLLLILIFLFQRFSGNQQQIKINLQNSNQILLNQAKIYLKNNQASGFNRAIQKARQIQPNTPLYSEAQRDINRWSQVIFDIAQGRGKNADFQGAITAAKLIPAEQTSVYFLAKTSIKKWQFLAKQQQNNKVLIEAAQAIIKADQASSYNRAITILQNINPDEIGYDKAQKLINQWSQNIYQIAQFRASQGKFKQAIITAELIPPHRAIYQSAKQAITRWNRQKL